MTASSDPDVRYSCVMAEGPAYAQQTLTWAWTLVDLAHVAPDHILVHALAGADTGVIEHLHDLGVRIVPCTPFRPGHPHCNKLRQLEHDDLRAADVAVLLDTDVACTGPVDDLLSSVAVRAKIADLPNPPPDRWYRILADAALPREAPFVRTSFDDGSTPAVNCNGGVLMLPGGAVRALGDVWPRWVDWLLARPGLLPPPFDVHIDQVAFGLALLDLDLPLDRLPLTGNFPTHALVGPGPDVDPQVLHYHDHVDASGFLAPIGRPRVDAAMARVNRVIGRRRRERFENRSFWDFRYRHAPGLGSGIGSRGSHLDAKRRLMAAEVRPADTVLDVGCGDLEVSRTLEVAAYTGIDVSAEALALARTKRPDWAFHHGDVHALDPAPHDVVVCLDVLIHQSDVAAYRALLGALLRLAHRTVIVSGYNQPPWLESEITFYHEPLSQSVCRIAGPAALEIVAGYRDATVLRLDAAAATASSPLLRLLREARRYQTAHGAFLATPGDLIASQFEQFGGHTRPELAMVLSLVREGDAILDVGAHVGTFTVPLARRVGPSGRVVAVEPDPGNLELLYQNLAGNGVGARVTVVEGLVADEPDPRRPVPSPTNSGATRFVIDRDGAGAAPLSVDHIADTTLAGRRPALLKIDVEGMEWSVLRSARATMASARPIVSCEIVAAQLERDGATLADLDRFFADHRYALFRNLRDRNARDDLFTIGRLASLADGGAFFDVLAVPQEDVARLVDRGLLPA